MSGAAHAKIRKGLEVEDSVLHDSFGMGQGASVPEPSEKLAFSNLPKAAPLAKVTVPSAAKGKYIRHLF